MRTLIVIAGLAAGCAPAQTECPAAILGTWEYRQAAGDGFDQEGERLVIGCSSGALTGLYYGLEREGEHGLFYTLVEVTDLNWSPAGELSFTVPARDLFSQRPSTLEQVVQQSIPTAGFTREELSFHGPLRADELFLACSAKPGACPDAELRFRRFE